MYLSACLICLLIQRLFPDPHHFPASIYPKFHLNSGGVYQADLIVGGLGTDGLHSIMNEHLSTLDYQGKCDPDTALEKGLVHLVNFCFLPYLFLILTRKKKKKGTAVGLFNSSSDSTPGRSKEHQIVMRLAHF